MVHLGVYLVISVSVVVSRAMSPHRTTCPERSPCRCLQLGGRDLPGLRVDCSLKNLTKITSLEIILPSVVELDFSSNKIKKIMKNKFFTSKTVRKLNLSRNMLERIANGALADFAGLVVLDLSQNNLAHLESGVFHGIYNLKTLNLSSNKFTSFSQYTFQHLPILEVLSLNYNNLGDFFSTTGDIFSASGLSLNPKLSVLHLKNVNLSNLMSNVFTSAYNLREVTIAENSINTFPKLPYTLEVLDLSSTDISIVSARELSAFPSLKKLKLNSLSKLREIGNQTFLPLKGLKELELQNCKNLQVFSPFAFGILIAADSSGDYEFPLTSISFLGSGLCNLDERLAPLLSRLIFLDLRGNPWNCDCDIKWLSKLKVSEEQGEFIRCSTPSELTGQLLNSVQPLLCSDVFPLRRLTVSALVVSCALLAGLVLWLVMLWPPPTTPPYRPVHLQLHRAELLTSH